MASVSSLDQDMRKLRLDRYTPQAANEVRSWIEQTLGEQLPPGDLLDSLKDGVALCKLANLALPPPGVKYKSSSMPFVQRENISHFLRACEMPPLNLPAHDRFLTVDLYDNKDPAQVIQCIGAFSRAAHATSPAKFPEVIGPKAGARSHARGAGSVESAGGYGGTRGLSSTSQGGENVAARALSPALTGGSSSSRATDASRTPTVSSWSKKGDETVTAPAWNIHQYGYMGGASQGNQGINFGARRQITSPSVHVPSLAEKERLRKEQDAEAERVKREQEERRRQQEERDRLDERERWEEESRKARDKQKEELERQRKQWEEEERKWKEEEEKRKREEELAAAALPKTPGASALRGSYLGQQGSSPHSPDTPEKTRIQELEKQLQEARERERQYQLEREQNKRPLFSPKPSALSSAKITTKAPQEASTPQEASIESLKTYLVGPSAPTSTEKPEIPTIAADSEAERESLQREWQSQQEVITEPEPPAVEEVRPSTPTRRLPVPGSTPAVNPVPMVLRPGSPMRTPSELEREEAARPSSSGRTAISLTSYPEAQARPVSPAPAPADDKPYVAYSPKPASPFMQARAQNSTPASGPATPTNRTGRFLASNPSPFVKRPTSSFANEVSMSSTAEQAGEDTRRIDSQQATKAGGWASKSLMEREMERERQRQKEWEEEQMVKTRQGGPKGPRAMR